MRRLTVAGEPAQEALGAALAAVLPPACVVYLRGDLGAGKTTLARGLIRGLGHAGAVKSPTYGLLEPYDLPERRCCHLDLYRLGDPEELEYLGIRDLLQEETILLVEWPERGAGVLPPADLTIEITHRHACRQIGMQAHTEKGRALLHALDLSSWEQLHS